MPNTNRKVLLVSAVHPDLVPPVHNVAKAYSERGLTVDVLSFGYSKAGAGITHSNSIFFYTKGIYTGSFFRKVSLQLQFYSDLRRLQRTTRSYHYVIAFCPMSFFWASFLFGCSNVIMHCLEIYIGARFPSFDFFFLRFFSANVENARRLLTPSFERSEYLRKKYSLKTTPGVILNAPFIERDFEIPFFARVGDCVRVIHTGGLNESRGLIELLRGFAMLERKFFELIITNIAADPYSMAVKALVSSEGMTNVKLLPTLSRSELLDLQRSADVGVCFIKRIGSVDTEFVAPNKLGEYLGSGLVCLVSDHNYFRSLGRGDFFVSVNIDIPDEVANGITTAKYLRRNNSLQTAIQSFIVRDYNMTTQLEKNGLFE